MDVTIWHNPACSNSRGALKLIRDAGFEPVVIDYLGSPPDVATLRQVLAESGLAATGLVRSKESEFAALGLQGSDDDALLAAMATHPRLINRPVVRTAKGTRLCRPRKRCWRSCNPPRFGRAEPCSAAVRVPPVNAAEHGPALQNGLPPVGDAFAAIDLGERRARLQAIRIRLQHRPVVAGGGHVA